MVSVTDIKYNSPAHTSGKIEDGDEIVQINYQTVIGWQYKKVIQQLQESPPDVLLTLKKRPKHTKIYGQIYMKPYRLPSKKKTLPYRLGENLPSPRPELLSISNFPLPLPLACVPEKHISSSSDSDSSCSDILTPTEQTKVNDKDGLRLYLPKPRAVLQRRNTICGDQASGFRGNVVFWHERRDRKDQESPSLRDKSVSFGFGLEMTARPTTCIGIQNVGSPIGKFGDFGGALKGSLPDMNNGKENEKNSSTTVDKPTFKDAIEVAVATTKLNPDGYKFKPGISKVVRFESKKKFENYKPDNKFMCNIDNTIVETFEPIPYVDDEEIQTLAEEVEEVIAPAKAIVIIEEKSIKKIEDLPVLKPTRMAADTGLAQAVNQVLVNKDIPGVKPQPRPRRRQKSISSSDDESSDSGKMIKIA